MAQVLREKQFKKILTTSQYKKYKDIKKKGKGTGKGTKKNKA
jgi:hypothetical protein